MTMTMILLKPVSMRTDTDALNYKVPGGMLSNLVSQLDQAGALNRLDEVLAETPVGSTIVMIDMAAFGIFALIGHFLGD